MSVVDEIIGRQVDLALMEDVGPGDITTLGSIVESSGRAEIAAKSDGVMAGLPIMEAVFLKIDPEMTFQYFRNDGDHFQRGDKIVSMTGSRRAIMTGERTALNFLGHLSGIAGLTAEFVEKTRGTSAKILDTRKTTPGLRYLEKYAVTCGGGENHRFGLYDMALIKDNHIAACGSIKSAVENLKKFLLTEDYHKQFMTKPEELDIEVEVATESQLKEAVTCGIKRLLLDNQSPENLKKLVKTARALSSDLKLEASGNVTLENIAAVAATGVDYISIGALTHSAPTSDFSLEFCG